MGELIFTTPYVPLPGHDKMTWKCLQSFKGMADRVIVVQNGVANMEYGAEDLMKAYADIYITCKYNRLHGGAVNLCSKLAQPSDYLIFANNDCIYEAGDLRSLCVPGAIVSPNIHQHAGYGAHASFFVVQKRLFDAIGFWDLSKKHAADDDWFKRAQSMGIRMYTDNAVSVTHEPAQTIGQIVESEHDIDFNNELRAYIAGLKW